MLCARTFAMLVSLIIALWLIPTPSFAGWSGSPEFGTCQVCCSVYPSGWRGMCWRRCMSMRKLLPRELRRVYRCECSFNWRGEWSCGRW